MKRGIVGVCSPFRGEGDSCVCGSAYGKGEFRGVIHKYLLGAVDFITDFYTAIACCACRSGGFQCYHGCICCQRIGVIRFGKLGCGGVLINLIGQLIGRALNLRCSR